MKYVSNSRARRASLLASASLCLTVFAGAAQAQSDPAGEINRPNISDAMLAPHSAGDTRPASDFAEPDPQIVIGFPGTPTTARDPVNVTGIGQMIIDNKDGTIGLCTGTLINPRAVIFAAHCVNTRAAGVYGAPSSSGGFAIGFGFQANNNVAGASAFGGWLNGVAGGPAYQTNTGRYMYNVNQVAWHQDSTAGVSGGFRQADVAIATLDTPAKDIPTWAMLFSALPQTAGGANGTGYHVNIAGYGNNGTGATGSTGGIDYRRRLAENMLGALVSLDDFTSFLFGSTTGQLPQNLYWIDFDDPRRFTGGADARDFNAFRDNPTPNEGITASGDSGGPLILDRTYAKQLVIGVLSGGYTRFFNGAPPNGYGTASFYQPLYLYWDWIAANNPYRYVSSLAGDANWTDASHWVTNVDPNYQIIGPNGQVVTGVPGSPGTGIANSGGEFGEACFESGGTSECYNYATGVFTTDTRPIGRPDSPGAVRSIDTEGTTNDAATADASSLNNNGGSASAQVFSIAQTEPEAQANQSPNALPAATIANGLPGATNFVPNNINANPGQGTIGRYFDVTLAATGTTTLNSAVTIDRFAIAGGGARLDITSTGSLTSLIDITQATGTLQVNGALTSPGDYLLMTGGLNGTGTITTPFFTNMAGTVAPGTAGTTGTLTFRGNVILTSGSRYLVDLGASGVSDRIAVNTNGAGTGLASVGGTLSFNFLNPTAIRNGDSYTILTSQGGISGRFNTPGAISAILTPTLSYTANAVTLQIVAGQYGNVIDRTNAVQTAYGMLLDRNRGQASRYDGLYGPLDLASQANVRTTLGGLAPAADTTAQSLGIVAVDNMSSFLRGRLDDIEAGNAGGTVARYGAVTEVASNLTGTSAATRGVAGLSGMGFGMDVRSDAYTPMVQENVLPETMSAFFAGGYLNGDSAAMTGIGGRDDFDGWYAAAGIEVSDDKTTIGFAGSYTRLDGTSSLVGNSARANLYQGSIYGKINLGLGANLDTILSAGLLETDTTRVVSFVGTPYTLRSNQGSLAVATEVGLGYDFDLGAARVTPRVAGRATHIGFSREIETGGPMALMTNREPINSIQVRGGLTLAGTGTKVRPFLNGTVVHDFSDRPAVIGANFVGGVGGNVLFALNGQDHDWVELSGGLTVSTGRVDFSVSAETTLERDDVKSQAYRGSLSFKF
ncbi:autotransporter outer membrane beta-barrel domain-containing protein [Sphingomonas sp. G-3-2-10]|uniref:autotransporter outer membrane beta-barrel domain-containing protein n=1 Tax=Sphingomonas sp. G-3-2-10 TaxID=2728838 RepID=UPI001F0EDEF1|nr:autotransporter outer membrane beta-barrel domain-containing protein [Sphingomonas sp. G-3-2-10]